MVLPEAIQTIEADGITENRIVVHRAPENLTEGQPLVIILHEYAGTAENAINMFGLAGPAADRRWALVAPSGQTDSTGNQYWAANLTCCDRDGTHNDDLGYLRQVIRDAIVRYDADRDHVVVVGGSNGAFMAYQLACHASDLVAAVVVVAGAESNAEAACTPRQPVSVFHLHGRGDLAVKFAGDELSVLVERIAPYPGAEETVERWSRRNGCPTAAPQDDFDVVADRGVWLGCDGGTTVQFAWLDQGHDLVVPSHLVDAIHQFIERAKREPTTRLR